MIKEDAPVTTTSNAGAGMTEPKLPIVLVSRYMSMRKRPKKAPKRPPEATEQVE